MAGGGSDTFVAQFTPSGALASGTYLGGSAPDAANAIALGSDGSVYVAVITSSFDFPGITALLQTRNFLVHLRIADPKKQDGPCMALALQNGASFAEGPVAPGEIVTLRGSGFGPVTGATPAGPVATILAGVQVFFDNLPAPLLYAQSQQINAIVPWELAGQTTTQVHVEYQGVPTNTTAIRLAASAPGIFYFDFKSQQGAILNEDGTVNSAANPAKAGSVIAIFGTGGGLTSPLGVTGGLWPASPLAMLNLPVSVRISLMDATVLYAGAAPTLISGVIQINARVPGSLPASAAWPVDVKIGDASSPSSAVTVAVR
jgi:uncharacterized protein (TIGR03437 family)